MREFLASSESKDVQFKAWQKVTALPAEKLISAWGGEWNTKRGRSIAYSLVNSGGPSFLQKHAKNGKLSPNDAMEAYNRWYHAKEGGSVRSRMRILNKLYPDPNFKPTFQPSKYA